jgi:membrane protein
VHLPTIQQPDDLVALVKRARSSFLVRCVLRFVTIQGFDRAIVISSQAFTALIPLFILVAAFTPADGGNAISEAIIERFALSGESAAAVEQLFASPPGATSSLTLFSAMLLLYSGVAFTRRTQHMYRSAWGQEKRGLRSTVSATLGLLAILLGIALGSSVRSVAASFEVDWLAMALVSLPLGMVLWTLIPYLLLDRGVHWRRLVVSGVAAAVAMTTLSIATPIYMPELIVQSANQFGLFGITIALIGWLLVTAVLLVGTASVGAEFDASDAYWALRAKARWRLLDPAQPRPVVPSGRDPRGLNVDDVRALVRVLANWLIMTGAVWVATVAVPGITVEGDALTYTAVALVLGLANAVLGPTLSLVIGLNRWLGVTGVALVVNTLLLVLTAVMTAQLEIDNLGSAVLGGAVIAVTGTLLTVVLRPVTDLASTRDR